MATLEIKDAKGKAVGKHEVAKPIAEAAPSMTALHRAVVAENANRRQGTQKTKTRSEVRGGGRKPYKQKKTGNARQGTIRAPHYAHGGMALALTPRAYTKKVNRKERRAAILGALHAQIEAGNMIVIDKIAMAAPKTKDALKLLAGFGLSDVRRVLVVVKDHEDSVYKSFRNIANVTVKTAPAIVKPVEAAAEPAKGKKKAAKVEATAPKTEAIGTRDILVAHKILVTADAMKQIEEVWAK